MLVADIVASEGCDLAGGAAKPGSAAIGRDLGEMAGIGRIGIAAIQDAGQVLRDSDVAIDFTTPAATAAHAALAAELGRALVVGTTGLSG
jgi:4-hydroxy-tetrahydrodipicolinate reductase